MALSAAHSNVVARTPRLRRVQDVSDRDHQSCSSPTAAKSSVRHPVRLGDGHRHRRALRRRPGRVTCGPPTKPRTFRHRTRRPYLRGDGARRGVCSGRRDPPGYGFLPENAEFAAACAERPSGIRGATRGGHCGDGLEDRRQGADGGRGRSGASGCDGAQRRRHRPGGAAGGRASIIPSRSRPHSAAAAAACASSPTPRNH